MNFSPSINSLLQNSPLSVTIGGRSSPRTNIVTLRESFVPQRNLNNSQAFMSLIQGRSRSEMGHNQTLNPGHPTSYPSQSTIECAMQRQQEKVLVRISASSKAAIYDKNRSASEFQTPLKLRGAVNGRNFNRIRLPTLGEHRSTPQPTQAIKINAIHHKTALGSPREFPLGTLRQRPYIRWTGLTPIRAKPITKIQPEQQVTTGAPKILFVDQMQALRDRAEQQKVKPKKRRFTEKFVLSGMYQDDSMEAELLRKRRIAREKAKIEQKIATLQRECALRSVMADKVKFSETDIERLSLGLSDEEGYQLLSINNQYNMSVNSSAAVVIQRMYRGWRTRRLVKTKLKARKAAQSFIAQTLGRVFREKQSLRAKVTKATAKDKAIRLLQRICKGFLQVILSMSDREAVFHQGIGGSPSRPPQATA